MRGGARFLHATRSCTSIFFAVEQQAEAWVRWRGEAEVRRGEAEARRRSGGGEEERRGRGEDAHASRLAAAAHICSCVVVQQLIIRHTIFHALQVWH